MISFKKSLHIYSNNIAETKCFFVNELYGLGTGDSLFSKEIKDCQYENDIPYEQLGRIFQAYNRLRENAEDFYVIKHNDHLSVYSDCFNRNTHIFDYLRSVLDNDILSGYDIEVIAFLSEDEIPSANSEKLQIGQTM